MTGPSGALPVRGRLGTVLATASPANADDGAAPSCVNYYQGYYYLQAENTCDYDVQVYARYESGAQGSSSLYDSAG